ncbi:MAG: polyprenyl synthetase family protein [Saccharofermentanales bacterium]
MLDFETHYRMYKDLVNAELERLFPETGAPEDIVREAAYFSLSAGGKRIRPVLCMSVAELFGSDLSDVLAFASAIEMIHTFSLIHDDLPGMDNDDFRRGVPTCHKVYGEGMAILAGDALLNMAYQILLDHCILHPDMKNLKAASVIAKATGIAGMIGGQTIDIISENQAIDLAALENMHRMKTGALIKAPVLAASVISEVPDDIYAVISEYAERIGLAFQIKDDILDVDSESEQLGKTTGKDARSGKSTFVTLLGLQSSKNYLKDSIDGAYQSLEVLADRGYDVCFLKDLTGFLFERKN